MAENKNDNPSFFSIEDTMDMGVGNTELIKDLMEPETISAKADDIAPITIEETTTKKVSTTGKITTKKVATTEETTTEKPEEEEPKQDVIASFLEKNPDEDEGEDEVDDKEKNKETPESKEEGAPNQFTALSKDLFKLGIFTKDEEDEEEPTITSPEEFLERFQNEKKKGATEALQTFIGRFGEDYQDAFDAIFVKGANPKDYFSAYNAVVDYAQMDMTKPENQEKVIRQALTDQGLDPEDVNTEVERLKNYGDLEAVAAKHHKVLVKKEAVKLQQIEQKAEEDQRQKSIIKNQYITNVQNILQEKVKAKEFDGIPMSPKIANELQDFLLVDKWKTPSGETLTDFDRAILELKRPENHANKVKLGLLLKLLEKDPTLSVMQRSASTKKNDQIFSETAKQITKINKGGGSTNVSIRDNAFKIL